MKSKQIIKAYELVKEGYAEFDIDSKAVQKQLRGRNKFKNQKPVEIVM